MANTVLVGLQWGDEGKGKIIDFLAEEADVVVRFQGGNNAGHTVKIGKEQFILHLVPSGILHDGVRCVIGNGVVVNPVALTEEVDALAQRGVTVDGRLQLSSRAQLLFQYHCLLDGLSESTLGERKIGTTKRGIGPAYADKVSRIGIRASSLLQLDKLETLFRTQACRANEALESAGSPGLDVDAEWAKVRRAASVLAPMVADTVLSTNNCMSDGQSVLFEGAQGTWLDVDHGTYPYVTSSNTIAGAACTGSGVSPRSIDKVLGVAKAYTTRVGMGPFPTELDNNVGETLREIGAEYGATTGRPRRCGWFDAVATRYATMLNGVDALAVTKLDVLDSFETIRVCTAYELDGNIVKDMPSEPDDLARVVPVYEECPGWQCSSTDAHSWDDLPGQAKEYVAWLADLVRAKVEIVSTGPRRDQTAFTGH